MAPRAGGYGNAIDLFDTPAATRKRLESIVTDSTPVEALKAPATCNVFAILSLMADEAEVQQWQERYRAGGMGYGEVKKRVYELFEARPASVGPNSRPIQTTSRTCWLKAFAGQERLRSRRCSAFVRLAGW